PPCLDVPQLGNGRAFPVDSVGARVAARSRRRAVNAHIPSGSRGVVLPVAVDGIRHVPAEAARIDARVGSTLCETPVHFHLNGLRTGGTIHKDEIFLLEHLLNPASEGDAFVVGTAFGLSSVVLALLLPRVRVISLDNWSEGDDAL